MKEKEFQQILEKYADLAVEIGLNLQPGQRLFIRANQLELAPLVRKIVDRAYQGGCPLVSVLWQDDHETKSRFEHAPRDSFEAYPSWRTDAQYQGILNGDALLGIRGDSPDLLKGYDQDLVAKAAKAYAENVKPIREKIVVNAVQWLGICPPTPGWASAVFPELREEEALEHLWEAVIQACRLNQADPQASWRQNLDALKSRAAYLTAKGYQALHFRAPGTDLQVGLPEGHIWIGGWDETPEGVQFCANLPTEEVFTLPHRERVNGTVKATMPLSYQGRLIEDFQLTFKNGKVVDHSAASGQEALQGILETGPNASFLGEVALVPHSSPISQLGLVFLNTLYDENASNHLALGKGYRFNLEGGTDMTDDEFTAAGGNDSLVHVDFMFGSGEMDVDGLLEDGTSEPLMQSGEWAFKL